MDHAQGKVAAERLSVTLQRYLANHVLSTLRNPRNWKKQLRGEPGSNFRILGAHSGASTSEVVCEVATAIAPPEERLGLTVLYAVLLSSFGYEMFLSDMEREGLWWGWMALLTNKDVRRAWYVKKADPANYQPEGWMQRNPHAPESGAEASVRLLTYCDIRQASEAEAAIYLEHYELERSARRMKPSQILNLAV